MKFLLDWELWFFQSRVAQKSGFPCFWRLLGFIAEATAKNQSTTFPRHNPSSRLVHPWSSRLLPDPVDYSGALCTAHPVHACALRALLLLPHQPVDMFALGLRNLSTCLIQSTTPSTQSTRWLQFGGFCMVFGFLSTFCSNFTCFCMIFTIPTKSTQKLKTKWNHTISSKIIK